MVLLAIGIAVVVSIPLAATRNENLTLVVAIVALQAGVAVATYLWVRLRHRGGLHMLGVRDWTRSNIGSGVLTGLGGLALAQFVVGPIVVWLAETVQGEAVDFPSQLDFERPGTGILVLTGFAVVVVAPFAEELFFRGFVYRAMRRWAPVHPAAALSALVFALVHVEPLIMPSIFVLGVLLAHSVERKDSIVPAIVAHGVFNVVGYTVFVVTL